MGWAGLGRRGTAWAVAATVWAVAGVAGVIWEMRVREKENEE